MYLPSTRLPYHQFTIHTTFYNWNQAMHTMRKNTNLTPHSQRTMGRKKK